MTSEFYGHEQREKARELLTQLHKLPPDAEQRKPLRDQLAEMHLPLVHYLARRFSGRGAAIEDLIQVGSIGLLKAIDRFDPERGAEFSTYAAPTIVGEIKRYFRDTGWLVHVPRRAQELQTTLAKARDELSQELHRAPTVAELAVRSGASEEEVVEALDVARGYAGVPLDVVAPSVGGAHAGETDDMERAELRELLKPALAALPERDRMIVVLRFMEGRTQTEIAQLVGVSQMQVSRLIAKSLARMRDELGPQTAD